MSLPAGRESKGWSPATQAAARAQVRRRALAWSARILLVAATVVVLGGTETSASVRGVSGSDTVSTCAPAVTPAAVPDTTLDDLFSAQVGRSGPAWLGGDIAYSTMLPDGQEAFDFNDTVIGTATEEGASEVVDTPYEPLIHNSQLVGTLPLTKSTALSTDQGGTPAAPQTLIPDANDSGGYAHEWEVGATVVVPATATVPAEQIVFVSEYTMLSPGDLIPDGTSAMAVFSLPAGGLPTYQSTIVDSSGSSVSTTIMWGKAVIQSGGYTYVYGNDGVTDQYGDWMYLARVASAHIATLSDWQYFSPDAEGDPAWVNQESGAAQTLGSQQFTGVTQQIGGIGFESVLLKGSETAPTINVQYACNPWGPWSHSSTVYTPPETTTFAPDEIAYIPTFHPELDPSGDLVISYSINNNAGLTALRANMHEYQPRFVLLPAPAPGVTSISPTSGPTAGDTTVTIVGTNFNGATKVKFGAVAATSFAVVSPTEITAVSPAQGASKHNVLVTTPGGTSAQTPADEFTYTS